MKNSFSIKERMQSFVYAWQGIRSFISKGHNAWIHCAAVVLVTSAGFLFQITTGEWLAVIFCFGLVLAAEAFNTAIEKLVDFISTDKHPALGNIKDISAGAVLICAIAAAIIGAIIFIPYVLEAWFPAFSLSLY